MTNKQVLLMILAFVGLTVGSFIWYIATWDDRQANSNTNHIILPQILPPEAPAFQERAAL